eukprot:245219-Pleurochrysis_carterae.AAC.1
MLGRAPPRFQCPPARRLRQLLLLPSFLRKTCAEPPNSNSFIAACAAAAVDADESSLCEFPSTSTRIQSFESQPSAVIASYLFNCTTNVFRRFDIALCARRCAASSCTRRSPPAFECSFLLQTAAARLQACSRSSKSVCARKQQRRLAFRASPFTRAASVHALKMPDFRVQRVFEASSGSSPSVASVCVCERLCTVAMWVYTHARSHSRPSSDASTTVHLTACTAGCCSPVCVYALCDPFPNMRRIKRVECPVRALCPCLLDSRHARTRTSAYVLL